MSLFSSFGNYLPVRSLAKAGSLFGICDLDFGVSRARERSGFTLIETLLYASLLAIALGGSLAAFSKILEQHRLIEARMELFSEETFAFNILSNSIRNAQDVILPASGATSTVLQLSGAEGVYQFDVLSESLRYAFPGSGPRVLLSNHTAVKSFEVKNIPASARGPVSVQVTLVLETTLGRISSRGTSTQTFSLSL